MRITRDTEGAKAVPVGEVRKLRVVTSSWIAGPFLGSEWFGGTSQSTPGCWHCRRPASTLRMLRCQEHDLPFTQTKVLQTLVLLMRNPLGLIRCNGHKTAGREDTAQRIQH